MCLFHLEHFYLANLSKGKRGREREREREREKKKKEQERESVRACVWFVCLQYCNLEYISISTYITILEL